MEQFYEIEVYEDEKGKAPYSDWFLKIRDKRAAVKLQMRLDRVTLGNFGDWKDIKGVKGLRELREHYGSGYRIYYTIVGNKIVVLLAGSTKSEQDRAITKAEKYLADYERRKDHD